MLQLEKTCQSSLLQYSDDTNASFTSTASTLTTAPLLANEILLLQRNYFTPFMSAFQFLARHAPSRHVVTALKSQYAGILQQFFLADLKAYHKILQRKMVK